MVKCFLPRYVRVVRIVAYIFKNCFSVPGGGNMISKKHVLAGYYPLSLPPLEGFAGHVDAQKTPRSLSLSQKRIIAASRMQGSEFTSRTSLSLPTRNTGL